MIRLYLKSLDLTQYVVNEMIVYCDYISLECMLSVFCLSLHSQCKTKHCEKMCVFPFVCVYVVRIL